MLKRIILYVLILGAVLLIPVERVDVAKLQPIEVIMIQRDRETVILQTDTGDMGTGADTIGALENMKATSPAVIYLDTAEFLLIGEGAEQDAQQLRQVLKKTVRVCRAEKTVDVKGVARYLTVHGKLPQLKQWEPRQSLPQITIEHERLKMS